MKAVSEILERVQLLADMPMEDLHALNPGIEAAGASSRSQTIAVSRQRKWTRGQLVKAILEDELDALELYYVCRTTEEQAFKDAPKTYDCGRPMGA